MSNRTKRIIIIAVIAGLFTALLQMLFEGFSPEGAGFWAIPIFISALFITGTLSLDFSLVPVIVGISLQLSFLIMVGLINEEIFKNIKTRLKKIIASVSFSLLVFILVWFVIFPIIDPVMSNLNVVVFLITNVIWGLIIGITSSLNEEDKIISPEIQPDNSSVVAPIVENINKNDPLALSDEKVEKQPMVNSEIVQDEPYFIPEPMQNSIPVETIEEIPKAPTSQ